MAIEDFSGFINEFLEEAEEHLQTLNSCLLEIEKSSEKGEAIKENIDTLFRSAHTIKGLAGMIELANIEELSHHIEDILGEMRNNAIQPSTEVMDLLFLSVDFLVKQVNALKEEGTDANVKADKLIRALKNVGEEGRPPELEEEETKELPEIVKKLGVGSYAFGDAELPLLKEAYEARHSVYEITKEFTGGLAPGRMMELPVFTTVEKMGKLIATSPSLGKIYIKKGMITCRILFSSKKPIKELEGEFMDPVRVIYQDLFPSGSSGSGVRKPLSGLSQIMESLDDAIIEEYLSAVFELLESVDSNLAELENNPSRTEVMGVVNSDLRTIRGGSAMLGFSAISALTFGMMNLFEYLENKGADIDSGVLVVIFECMKKLRKLLEVIKRRKDNGITVERELGLMAGIFGRTSVEDKVENIKDLLKLEKADLDLLDPNEIVAIAEAHAESLTIFDIRIIFNKDLLMKGYEPLLSVPIIEEVGNIIARIPMIENVPSIEGFSPDEFMMGFRFLFSSHLDKKEIKKQVSLSEGIEKVVLKAVLSGKAPQKSPKPASKALVGKDEGLAAMTQRMMMEKETHTIRVDIERMDKLLNLVGELITDRTLFERISGEMKKRNPHDQLSKELTEINLLFQRHMNEIQGMIMSVRMVPIGKVFNRLPRMVRDLAKALGKKVEISFSGEETELDKTLVDEVADPLMHIVRNAVDHGIEPPKVRGAAGKNPEGTVKLKAYHEANSIIVEVADDGRGLDIVEIREKAKQMGLITGEEGNLTDQEIMRFIFEPSFSTAKETTKVSGRGVGMDVVKKNIIKLKGLIDVYSQPGAGARFVIRMPLTLAIVPALMVGVEHEIFAVPLSSVIESIRIPPSDINILQGREMINLRGSVMPLLRLDNYFKLDRKKKRFLKNGKRVRKSRKETDAIFIVVVGMAEKRLGIAVDELIQQQEVVIKSMGSIMGDTPGISGATITGDGRVALILDLGSIIDETSRQERKALLHHRNE